MEELTGEGDEDDNFGPTLGSDGKPLEFGFTNEQFADAFCPWLRMAFMTIGRDREGVTDMVRGLAEDDDDACKVYDMLRAWDEIAQKFDAVAAFTRAAWQRVMAVSEVLVEEDTDIGRALNRGAGPYLDSLEREATP